MILMLKRKKPHLLGPAVGCGDRLHEGVVRAPRHGPGPQAHAGQNTRKRQDHRWLGDRGLGESGQGLKWNKSAGTGQRPSIHQSSKALPGRHFPAAIVRIAGLAKMKVAGIRKGWIQSDRPSPIELDVVLLGIPRGRIGICWSRATDIDLPAWSSLETSPRFTRIKLSWMI